MERSWKESMVAGVIAGVVWGWLSMAANSVTGIFPFESSFAHNFMAFTFGGAVFGVVAGGFLNVAGRFLPFRSVLARAVVVSATLWVVLRLGGAMLSSMEPMRYHMVTPQVIQGFTLALILGTLLGITWKKGLRPSK
ncbi:MAG: hypothetical protein ACE5GY_07470 [Thermodesulfobacteriota bacterium]